MPFVKKFELKLRVPEMREVAGHMADLWAERLGDSGELIKDKLDIVLPDDGTFITKLVNPSSDAYAPYVNPGFVSKSERTAENIRTTRQSNLAQSFTRWKDNLAKAFATVDGVVAKFFKDKVAAAKDRWAIKVTDGTLRFTGDRPRGRGVAPVLVHYLAGDGRAGGWITEGDVADGMPYNIAPTGGRTALKAALMQRLVQGGLMVIKSGNTPAEILAQSAINATLLSGLRDPAKADAFVPAAAPDKCYCAWEIDSEGRLILHTQVGLTV